MFLMDVTFDHTDSLSWGSKNCIPFWNWTCDKTNCHLLQIRMLESLACKSLLDTFPLYEPAFTSVSHSNLELSYYYLRRSLLLTTFLPMKANTPAVTSAANITNKQAKNCRGRREPYVSLLCTMRFTGTATQPLILVQISTASTITDREKWRTESVTRASSQASCNVKTKVEMAKMWL